ncbi:MAG: DUF6077 domain-containing protein [Eubacteriales bacterium]|nr:DUF6077 domain-containing protein [Eubacteriales bacterium]
MEMAIKGTLAVFWLGLVPLFAGRLLFCKRKQPLLTECFLSGYALLFAVMEVLTLPMIYLKMPLHVLTVSYGAAVLLLAAAGIFVMVKQKDSFHFSSAFRMENSCFWIAAVLILLQIIMCVFLAHMDADDAFYVAQATTDVQTDTIFEVIPYTGQKYHSMPSRYVLSPFPVFLAVVSRLSAGLHPAIMAHMIFPAIFLMAAYSVQYLLGRKWFPDDRRGQGMYLFFVACVCSFSAYSVYNAGSFQMVRLWQGKAVLASVFLPFLFYLGQSVMMEKKSEYPWILLAMADMSCCLLSSMGIILGTLMFGVFLLLCLVFQRNWKNFLKGFCCCLPSLLLGIFYILVFKG